MSQVAVRLLDGGMGHELKRIGAPFRQPEWSALALIEAPAFVLQAHRAFIDAGARIATSNSYALVPFHLGEERFTEHGLALATLAGRLACEAAQHSVEPVIVAGSLPPVLGSYRPDLFDHQRSVAVHQQLIEGLRSHVDVWLAETQSSIAEVRAVREAIGNDDLLLWLSFTLLDDHDSQARSRLRSGETVEEAVRVAVELGATAVLFNCSQTEVMTAALAEARSVLDPLGLSIELGVYANAFPAMSAEAEANSTLLGIRKDLARHLTWTGRAHGWSRAPPSLGAVAVSALSISLNCSITCCSQYCSITCCSQWR